MVCFYISFKWPWLFQEGEHAHGRDLCQVWTIFDNVCKLQHGWAFIFPFLQRKHYKCKIYWKPKQLGMVPWIDHTRPWEKLGPFQGCRKQRALRLSLLTFGNLSPFFDKEITRKCKNFKNQKNLAWCLEFFIQASEKNRSFDGCRVKTCSQT